MNATMAWRLSLVVALCLVSVVPAGADGGDVLWQIEGAGAGIGRINYVTEDSNRLLAVGHTGRFGQTSSRPRFLVRLHDAATGGLAWSHEETSAAQGYASHGVLKGARAYVTGYVAQGPAFDARLERRVLTSSPSACGTTTRAVSTPSGARSTRTAARWSGTPWNRSSAK